MSITLLQVTTGCCKVARLLGIRGALCGLQPLLLSCQSVLLLKQLLAHSRIQLISLHLLLVAIIRRSARNSFKRFVSMLLELLSSLLLGIEVFAQELDAPCLDLGPFHEILESRFFGPLFYQGHLLVQPPAHSHALLVLVVLLHLSPPLLVKRICSDGLCHILEVAVLGLPEGFVLFELLVQLTSIILFHGQSVLLSLLLLFHKGLGIPVVAGLLQRIVSCVRPHGSRNIHVIRGTGIMT
mmetsp:Transcript_65457/g.153143  ORF Transcript_65457/g.153143 Transcript_65457/m.153143 type:complete len:240 (+) Transcript_65457:903-1622(+)